jgi:hypothetical protein
LLTTEIDGLDAEQILEHFRARDGAIKAFVQVAAGG